MAKAIHLNKDHPENHTMKVTNVKSPYIPVIQNEKWIMKDKKDVLKFLIEKIADILKSHFEDNKEGIKEKYNSYKRDAIEMYHERLEKEDKELWNKIMKDVYLMFANDKEIFPKTRKKKEKLKQDQTIILQIMDHIFRTSNMIRRVNSESRQKLILQLHKYYSNLGLMTDDLKEQLIQLYNTDESFLSKDLCRIMLSKYPFLKPKKIIQTPPQPLYMKLLETYCVTKTTDDMNKFMLELFRKTFVYLSRYAKTMQILEEVNCLYDERKYAFLYPLYSALKCEFIQRNNKYVSISNIFHIRDEDKKIVRRHQYGEKRSFQFFVSVELFKNPSIVLEKMMDRKNDDISMFLYFLHSYIFLAQVKKCTCLEMIPYGIAKGHLFV